MAPPRYQLIDRDSEKGDAADSVSREHLNSPTARTNTQPGIAYLLLGAIVTFLSGVLFTLALMNIKSEFYGMGQYETGFQEEKLRKSAMFVHYVHHQRF